MVDASDGMRSGGGFVMLAVPPPVMSRLLSVTWLSPSTCPISWARVHGEAIDATTAPGLPDGSAAQPLKGGTVDHTKYATT